MTFIFKMTDVNFIVFKINVKDQQTLEIKRRASITKTYLYNFDPLKPYFYIVKLGLTGVYIIFLISARKHRGGSNEYPQSMF